MPVSQHQNEGTRDARGVDHPHSAGVVGLKGGDAAYGAEWRADAKGSTIPTPGVAHLVGNTPLIPLKRIHPGGNLWAKLEWCNPGQSAKDRPAWNIIRQALDSGALTPDIPLLDATSGNTGIAYAMFAAALGIKVHLCMPSSVSTTRLKILQAYGATIDLTPAQEFSDGAIRKAQSLAKQQPKHWFYADQYGNPHNWQAHYHGTGVEIYQQTEGQVRHFVASLGTSGTFMGTGKRLKAYNPDIQLVEVQPDSPFHGLEGMKHMESSLQPAFYDPQFADQKKVVRTEDAYDAVRALASQEGLLAGVSCGAALVAAQQVALAHPDQLVVVVFPDNGLKYLDEAFWTP